MAKQTAKAAAEKAARRYAGKIRCTFVEYMGACEAFLAGVAWQRRQGRKKAKPRKQP